MFGKGTNYIIKNKESKLFCLTLLSVKTKRTHYLRYRHIYIWLLTLLLVIATQQGKASGRNIFYSGKSYCADSILDRIQALSPIYATFYKEYYANVYIKERFDILKRNGLFKFMPLMFRVRHNERQYIREMAAVLHYTAPNIYDQKILSSSGTFPRRKSLMNGIIEFFHVNVYSTTLLYQQLISPITKRGRKYYVYDLDSVYYDNGNLQYRIAFKPRLNNDELVSGYMIINDSKWTIHEFHFSGFAHLIHFDVDINYGDVGTPEELLPVNYSANMRSRVFGNKFKSKYQSNISYHRIQIRLPNTMIAQKNKYDVTRSYTYSDSKEDYTTDPHVFDSIRPIPLDTTDRMIYDIHERNAKEAKDHPEKVSEARVLWGEIGDILIRRYNINFSNASSVRCSPLFNPFLLGYSKNKGVSYRQSFKYNCFFRRDKILHIAPSLGYNFSRKELYWKVESYFLYWPRRIGELHFEMGNGNRVYGNDIVKVMKLANDEYDHIDQLQFRDTYMEVFNSIELANGLELDLGTTSHRRTATFINKYLETDSTKKDLFHFRYNSFAPRVGLKWTPGLYYYMSRHRKVNLQSAYPTFSIDWERGIKGIFNSNGAYERLEFDMQQTIDLGLTRSFLYRFGGGIYTNNHKLYFIDFINFTRNDLPEQWNDEGEGVFHLLERKYYSNTRKYLQGHLIYESPFLLFPRVIKAMKNVVKERLYFDALFTSDFKPYTEVGYGITTHYFNFEVFASFNKNKYREFGCKFGFELFNK
jgi:hypothetical protein